MKYPLTILALILSITLLPAMDVKAGKFSTDIFYTISETDAVGEESTLFYFFDLRERETYLQLTYPDVFSTGANAIAHVQIFNVSNNCNENNFFDTYTINDTHVYNMRDIQTNDGNPSGVVLPDDAYGIVAVTMFATMGGVLIDEGATQIGNLRIIDNKGHEYRTNALAPLAVENFGDDDDDSLFYSFNFNQESGVSFSDVVGITLVGTDNPQFFFEWIAQPVQAIFTPFDIDIVDNTENIFSCRDVIYSCINEDNPLREELLSIAGTASVASFEYGINNVIPHSKGGELLCPGNTISEGSVLLRAERYSNAWAVLFDSLNTETPPVFAGYVGLNNGNGRGSIDSFWVFNFIDEQP